MDRASGTLVRCAAGGTGSVIVSEGRQERRDRSATRQPGSHHRGRNAVVDHGADCRSLAEATATG